MGEHGVVQWIKENRIIFTSPLPVVIRLRINSNGPSSAFFLPLVRQMVKSLNPCVYSLTLMC